MWVSPLAAAFAASLAAFEADDGVDTAEQSVGSQRSAANEEIDAGQLR